MSNRVLTNTNFTRAIRAKEAATLLGIGVSTFWLWVKQGRLPKGTRLSSRCTIWLYTDIENFLTKVTEHADA